MNFLTDDCCVDAPLFFLRYKDLWNYVMTKYLTYEDQMNFWGSKVPSPRSRYVIELDCFFQICEPLRRFHHPRCPALMSPALHAQAYADLAPRRFCKVLISLYGDNRMFIDEVIQLFKVNIQKENKLVLVNKKFKKEE